MDHTGDTAGLLRPRGWCNERAGEERCQADDRESHHRQPLDLSIDTRLLGTDVSKLAAIVRAFTVVSIVKVCLFEACQRENLAAERFLGSLTPGNVRLSRTIHSQTIASRRQRLRIRVAAENDQHAFGGCDGA